MFRRLALIIHAGRWPIALILGLITLVLGISLKDLKIDPSMETLFIKKSPEYLYYRQYSEKYGSDQMIAVAMATTDLFTARNLRTLRQVTRDLEALPGVERVLSLANTMDIRPKFLGVKIEPALKGVFKGTRDLGVLRQDILGNELYVNNLISKDGNVANIIVYVKAGGKDRELSGVLIEKMRAYLLEKEETGLQFYVAGSPVEQYDFIRLIRRDQLIFVPLIALLLIATTYIMYQSFTCMVLSMSIVFMTLVWTLGTISVMGQQLNLMTSLLAPVMMIVSVVNSVYLINVFFEVRPHQPSLKKAIVLTLDQLGIPCFLTHFTAILGFASLALSPIPAIKSFGIFAALGTFYSYLVEITLTPLLFPMLPFRIREESLEKKSLLNHMLVQFIEKLELRWKWLILALTAAVIFFSVRGLEKIQVDTNIIKQMKPDLPLAVATRFIDENLTGVYSLGFVFRRRDGGTMVDYETLKRLDEFKDYMEAKPEISKINSITTVIKRIHHARGDLEVGAFKISENPSDLDRYFKGVMESEDAAQFISSDLKETRLEARMRAVGTAEGARVEETARQYLEEHLSPYFEYELTGNVVLLGKIAKGLVHEQVVSFAFALGSILLLIIIIFRSVILGLLAAIPNLIPILAVYGLMGYMQIELSTPTAMISSIVLGMVVDASIQFLYRFRIEFDHRGHYLQALHHTLRNMGSSMFISTMILVIGFASSVFASFRPTVHFGVLTSLTIFLAFVCTVVVLPVCIILVKPFGPQRLFHRKGKRHQHPHHRDPETGSDFSIQQKMQ